MYAIVEVSSKDLREVAVPPGRGTRGASVHASRDLQLFPLFLRGSNLRQRTVCG